MKPIATSAAARSSNRMPNICRYLNPFMMSELNCGGSNGNTNDKRVGGSIGSKPDRMRKENSTSSSVTNAHIKGRFCTLQIPRFSDASEAHLRQIPPDCHGTFTLCIVGSLHRTKNANRSHTEITCTSGKSFCSTVFGFCTVGKGAVDVEPNIDDPPGEGGPDCCIRPLKKSMLGSPFEDWLNEGGEDARLGFPTAAPMPSARMNSACWFSDHTEGSMGGAGCDRGFDCGVGRGNSGGSSPINVETDGWSGTGA